MGRTSYKSAEDSFWAKVIVKDGGCWEWIGNVCSDDGYGRFWYNYKMFKAHRYSYLTHKGELNGLCVCHTCDNRICTNPEHLFLGTPMDNVQDCLRKGRMVRSSKFNVEIRGVIKHEILTQPNNISLRQIAIKYTLNAKTVQQIKQGVIWKSIIAAPTNKSTSARGVV